MPDRTANSESPQAGRGPFSALLADSRELRLHDRVGSLDPLESCLAVGEVAVASPRLELAGDMLSDVLIPLFDSRQSDEMGAYETALDRLGEAATRVDVVVPGHGAVAEGPEVAARLTADRAYIEALRRGEDPVDSRLEADWLSGAHQSNLEQARGR